jgi:hypothetical protein
MSDGPVLGELWVRQGIDVPGGTRYQQIAWLRASPRPVLVTVIDVTTEFVSSYFDGQERAVMQGQVLPMDQFVRVFRRV